MKSRRTSGEKIRDKEKAASSFLTLTPIPASSALITGQIVTEAGLAIVTDGAGTRIAAHARDAIQIGKAAAECDIAGAAESPSAKSSFTQAVANPGE